MVAVKSNQATLKENDEASTVLRLADMKIQPIDMGFLVGSLPPMSGSEYK